PRHVDVWSKRATAFAGLTFLRHIALGLAAGTEHPSVANAVACSPNLFDILQTQPLLGRTFVPEDGVQGHDNVAILTYSLWQNLFHGDSGVIGKKIRLGDISREVIGVLPAGFHFPSGTALRAFRRGGRAVSGGSEPVVFFPVAVDVTQFEWNGNYGNWLALGR